MKDNVKIKTYQSGARLITETVKNSPYLVFGVYITVGANNELPEEKGVAHFLEHMMFKSNKNYATKEISEKMESLGARINAWTSESTTYYHFKCLNECFEECAEVYSSMLQSPLFLEDEFNQEKKVILEEIAADQDSPSYSAFLATHIAFMSNFVPNAHSVAAKAEDVKAITPQNLRDFMDKHYVGKNIIFSVIGNIEPEQSEQIIEKYFSELINKQPKQIETLNNMPLAPQENIVSIEKDTKQVKLCIYFKTEDLLSPKRYALRVLNKILGGGMSSRLFVEVRINRGLAYSIHSGIGLIGQLGYMAISAGIAPENLEEALNSIKNVLKDLAEKEVSEEELKKAKVQINSAFAFSTENKALIAEDNAATLRYYETSITDEEVLAKINAVTVEEIKAVAKQIYSEPIIVIGACGQNIDKEILKKFSIRE